MSRSSSQSSQNVDNFLREKPSTRQHQPPGGGSSVGSLIYGGGCDESPFANHPRRSSIGRVPKEEAPEQVNPYSKDYRRGSGNGGNDYGQHQQQSSGPYPGYQQQQQQPPPAQHQYQHQQHQAPVQQQQQYPGYQQQQQQQQQQYGGGVAAGSRQSSNSYASGSNQNAGNVLTERRITRIHAPPGGKSSITFG